MRTYLAGGLSLTPSLRAETEQMLASLQAATSAPDDADTRSQRLAIVAKMLLTYPVAGASSETGKARAEAYLEALDDVSPWAISAAVRAWNRGAAGDAHDYRWAPAPATLRKISLEQSAPYRPIIAHLENLLAAVAPEEAMKTPSPEDRAYVVDGFERLKVDIGTGRRPEPFREAAE
jgi:hypothetical protein